MRLTARRMFPHALSWFRNLPAPAPGGAIPRRFPNLQRTKPEADFSRSNVIYLTGTAFWQSKIECGALVEPALRPYATSMPVDNPLNRGEPYTGSRKLAGRVQPLKYTEQPARVSHVEPGAIVPYKKCYFAFSTFANRDLRLRHFAGEFPGIPQQIIHRY